MTDGYEVGDRVLVDDHLLGIVTEASKYNENGLLAAKVMLDGQDAEHWYEHDGWLRWIPPDDRKEEEQDE